MGVRCLPKLNWLLILSKHSEHVDVLGSELAHSAGCLISNVCIIPLVYFAEKSSICLWLGNVILRDWNEASLEYKFQYF